MLHLELLFALKKQSAPAMLMRIVFTLTTSPNRQLHAAFLLQRGH